MYSIDYKVDINQNGKYKDIRSVKTDLWILKIHFTYTAGDWTAFRAFMITVISY